MAEVRGCIVSKWNAFIHTYFLKIRVVTRYYYPLNRMCMFELNLMNENVKASVKLISRKKLFTNTSLQSVGIKPHNFYFLDFGLSNSIKDLTVRSFQNASIIKQIHYFKILFFRNCNANFRYRLCKLHFLKLKSLCI